MTKAKYCVILGETEVQNEVVNIKDTVDGLMNNLPADLEITPQTVQNIPPRVRMTTLYAVSQSVNGRVANTCNLSEAYIGWETRWGDAVGDFAPLQGLTCSEVIALGRELDLPKELIEKIPSDGLCGSTDEDAFGFTYDELDRWIRLGVKGENYNKIKSLHEGYSLIHLPTQTTNLPLLN